MKLDIDYLIENLTLEEKAGLCSGADFWHTKSVERLGIPAIMVSDGPHGLRKQVDSEFHPDEHRSVKAVCYPAGSALACSFDRSLMQKVGEYLGEEARAENIHTLLGPAINIKRSPLCGRNFEYLSEDPYLAGELSASYVKGVQSKNVGVSVKHYAANNQEYKRMSVDAIVDERTLREIYLKAFEITIKKSNPWTLMCAYNKLNGTYCSENKKLLTDIPRNEWGYEGIIMTDWGAMNDRVKAIKAGLELEMPSSSGYNDRKIVEAVKNGELDIEILNNTVRKLLEWIELGLNELPEIKNYDKELHHSFSRRVAGECAILLKNNNEILPLKKSGNIAFIGPFAKKPRYQGGGSSHVDAFKVTSAVEAVGDLVANNADLSIIYKAGIEDDGVTRNEALLKDAVEAAKASEAAVLFVGLPDSFEAESYDRDHMDMPDCQNELIEAVAAVQPNTVVVLHKGSPVTMPWKDQVVAILDMYLGGQAVGGAAVDILFGDVNPSGKLAESMPYRLEDTPCYLNFPGDGKKVYYSEGVFVGYRYYDSKRMGVMYPFGHGLSYTKFSIGDIKVSDSLFDGKGTVNVSVKVKNIGNTVGAEVVQLYISPFDELLRIRPLKELKGFEKVYLMPGEERVTSFELDYYSFAYYNVDVNDWHVEPGEYKILVGNSSRNITCEASLELKTSKVPFLYTETTTIKDVFDYGKGHIIMPLIQKYREQNFEDTTPDDEIVKEAMRELSVHNVVSFIKISNEELDQIIENLKKSE